MQKILFFQILALLPILLPSQSDTIPAQAYMHTNAINALVNADGLLFYDPVKDGQFLTDTLGRSPIRAAGLWLGGFDPGGNLKLATQKYNEDGKRDFAPGAYPDSWGNWNRIWRVTAYDILSHIRDYVHDRKIDDRLPAIYGWPSAGNPFFKIYNGFDLPENTALLPDFYDWDHDDIYNPDNGDFPILKMRGCEFGFFRQPSEIFWYMFHDNIEHTQSPGSIPILMVVSNTVFSFGCSDNPILNNSIFSQYKLHNAALEDIDSCFFGLFVDFELGCPEDDYLAAIPENNVIYAYNSSMVDETCGDNLGYGEYPPIASVKLIRGPFNEFRQEMGISSVMPILDKNIFPLGMSEPIFPNEHYNCLTGRWRDGTPMTYGGDGYDPISTDVAQIVYPGHPLDNGSWNEISSGNMPGHRKAVVSYGPFMLQPGAVNELMVAFTFFPNGQYPMDLQLHEVYEGLEFTMSDFDQCFGGIRSPCTPTHPVPPPLEEPLLKEKLTFRPNPADHSTWSRFSDMGFPDNLAFYDMTGKLMFSSDKPNEIVKIDVSSWPNGFYFAISRKGNEMHYAPLVIGRR